jgi:hypothetical protein
LGVHFHLFQLEFGENDCMYAYTSFHGPILATQAFGINDFDQAVGIYLNDSRLLPGPRVEGFFYSNGVNASPWRKRRVTAQPTAI